MNPESFEDNEKRKDEEVYEQLEFPDFLNTKEKRLSWFEKRRKYLMALVGALGIYAVTDFSDKNSKETEDEPVNFDAPELFSPEELEKNALELEARMKISREREAMPGKPYSEFWSNKDEEIKNRFMAVIDELVLKLGDKIDDDLMRADDECYRKKIFKKSVREEKEALAISLEFLSGRPHSEPKIVNFDKNFSGLSNYIGNLWSDQGGYYPKGWINGDIREITFSQKEVVAGEIYGKRLAKVKAAGNYISFFDRVNLFEDPKKTSDKKYILNLAPDDFIGPSRVPFSQMLRLDTLDLVFSHEVGHANDWTSDKDLNIAERAELLLSVIKRLESEDKFKSSYLDAIEPKEPPTEISQEDLKKIKEAYKKEMLLTKSREYWAEICQQYFSDPENFKKNYPKDYELVDKQVKKTDKNFNPVLGATQKVKYFYGCIPKEDFFSFPFSGERTRYPFVEKFRITPPKHSPIKKPPEKKKKK